MKEKTFTLTANDLNEAPKNIILTGDSILELQAINTLIGTLSSLDEDGGATHTYALTTGLGDTDNALFAINSNSLVSNVTYTFAGQYYSIRVKTTDNGGLTFEKVFLIKKTDAQVGSQYPNTMCVPSASLFLCSPLCSFFIFWRVAFRLPCFYSACLFTGRESM